MGSIRSELMSKAIVDIMTNLSKNKALMMLLINNSDNPFSKSISDRDIRDSINPKNNNARIVPFPFNPNAEQKDSSFVRVYYNIGSFDNSEVVMESEINIDIVVAKSLWLINDGSSPLIRAYEIMSRIVDSVGARSANPIVKFNGFQHLAVNNEFDAIRMYSNHFNVKG